MEKTGCEAIRSYGVTDKVGEPKVLDKLRMRRVWNHAFDNNEEEEEEELDNTEEDAATAAFVDLLVVGMLCFALDASAMGPMHTTTTKTMSVWRRVRDGRVTTIMVATMRLVDSNTRDKRQSVMLEVVNSLMLPVGSRYVSFFADGGHTVCQSDVCVVSTNRLIVWRLAAVLARVFVPILGVTFLRYCCVRSRLVGV